MVSRKVWHNTSIDIQKQPMTNKLYFYSFPANYEDQVALGRTPMLKIGETTQEAAEDRIKQQMGTATAQKYTVYGEFTASFTDKQFHTFLRSRGVTQPDGAGTEWFHISAPEAEKLVYEYAALVDGVATPIRQSLDSRPYQDSFVEMFKSSGGDFCLFAKCRSGKSAMTLLAATEAGYRSLLVVSYRTSAGNSWLSDALTYTVFHEWDVIDLSVKNWESLVVSSQKAGRRQLMVSTVQRQSEKFGYLKKLKVAYPDGVDLMALDECHIGGESGQFDKLKHGISYGRLLEISGTAYRTIWKYPRENVFVWGYVEEQRAKAEGYEWAQKLPKMRLVLAKYNADNLQQVYGDDPDALKNVFAVTEESKFQDPASVQGFLRKYFAYGAMAHKKQQMLRDSQHIVMTLPSVAACHLFAEALQQFGSPFAPLVITGDSGNTQDDILRHVCDNEATICLTRWANVVGVTVPQWDTVVHGCEYQSAEFWVQFAFRGGSTTRDSWTVIDFAPERSLSSILEMSAVTASVGDEDTDSVLRSFLEFADIYEFDNGYTQLDYETVLQSVNVGVETAKALTNGVVSATRVGSNLEALAWGFSDLDKMTNRVEVSELLNSNGTTGKGNVQLQRGDTTNNDLTKLAKETLARVKTAVSKIDDVVVDGLLGGENLSTLPKLLRYEFFEDITGCHADLFEVAINGGWVNERVLVNAVSQIHLALSKQLVGVL